MAQKEISEKKGMKKHKEIEVLNMGKKARAGIVLIIALFILTIISIYFISVNYIPFMTFIYDGYAVSGTELTDSLLSIKENPDMKIKALKINQQDMIFKKLKTYYIGQKEKKSINFNFPVYINNNIALYNLAENTKLITSNFEEIEGYKNFTLVSGVLFNQSDLTRADMNEYLFLKNEDNIYINTEEINVSTSTRRYIIPKNSIIYFSKDIISYYNLDGEYFKYNKISDIDLQSTICIKDNNYTYEDLLIRLNIQEDKRSNEKKHDIVIEKVEDDEDENSKEGNKNIENLNDNEDIGDEEENYEQKYIKPEVNSGNFTANVYSAKNELQIKDPSGKIVSAVTFTVRKKDKIYLRKSVISSGTFEILGLEPDSEYEIIGTYVYLNEEETKIEKKFLEQKIHTKTTDELNEIKLGYENGSIYSNKIELKNLKIDSDLSDEALKGVKRAEIVIDDVLYKIQTDKLSKLLKGESIFYETKEGIKSNSTIKYKIKFYDILENEMKIQNGEGKTKTCKQQPKVSINTKKQDITEVILELELKNQDKAKIDNYRYEINGVNGEIIKEEKIDVNKQIIILNDLDPNQYFTIRIYADYNIEDGNGIQTNKIIGSANFTSAPLSTLGYINLITKIVELKTNSINLSLDIDEERTDKRLIKILSEINIGVYKNDEKVNEIILKDEIQNLKENNTINLEIDNLKSYTEYNIKIDCKVTQGNTSEIIGALYSISSFTTIKEPTKVNIRNQFVTGEMIDFDVSIEDINDATIKNNVRLEFRDENKKLVKIEKIKTNQDYTRITYEKLEKNKNYKLLFYADEYNEGNDNATYKSNYLIKEVNVYTEPGISGQVFLTNMIRQGTGKNLVDMKSDIKWWSLCFNTNRWYGKEYDTGEKILKLLDGINSYQEYVYDLREYIGKQVTVSFYAKLDENSDGLQAYFQNSKNPWNNTIRIEGINKEEWKQYTYTVNVDQTGYLGFMLNCGNDGKSSTRQLLIKELQVELSPIKTLYKEYTYNLEANVMVNLEDLRGEISNKDYYIKLYEEDKLVVDECYKEIDENNKVVEAFKKYIINENKRYTLQLAIKIRDRFYILDEREFNSKNGEILGINNKEEFLQIQPNGNYVILQDIDLSGSTGATCRFGGDKMYFQGRIDFQGHTLTRDVKTVDAIFWIIGKKGIIENIVLNISMNNEREINILRGFVYSNSGTIKNIFVNLIECNELPNVGIGLIGIYNYGILENFIVNLQKPLYSNNNAATTFLESSGIIRNGYIYGENIEAPYEVPAQNWRNIGALVRQINYGGTLENVYSLVNVNYKEVASAYEYTSNIVELNNGTIKNIYSVGIGNTTRLDRGANVARNNVGKVYNSYYFCDKTFTIWCDKKTTPLALQDTVFQNNMLNSNNQFIVDELIQNRYFPHLKLSEVMPNQEYIELPKVEDEDLVDILSFETIEEAPNKVNVKMRIHNPSEEKIMNLKIKDATAKILSQTNNDGVTDLIVEISEPKKYLSKYSIMSITAIGAFKIPYTREFKENERPIYVDFYKEINSIEGWKNINKSPTENYKLMVDLDFIDETKGITISNRYTGKLNGNGHTIKNLTVQNSALFNDLNGQIKDLFIENYIQKTNKVKHFRDS